MSAPSSRRELIALGIALAACGKSAPNQPEADPAAVTKLAANMLREVPSPGGVRECTEADLDGGPTMTWRTLVLLGGGQLSDRVVEQEWINPRQLDAPDARTLSEPIKDAKLARQAAAKLLAAPFWVVYKVDNVNAPMALGVKDLKLGTIGTRIIRYEKTGLPGCVKVWFFENDQKVSDDAIAVSDKAAIDPAVAKILRDDLAHQYVTQAPRGSSAGNARAGSAK